MMVQKWSMLNKEKKWIFSKEGNHFQMDSYEERFCDYMKYRVKVPDKYPSQYCQFLQFKEINFSKLRIVK